MVLPDDRFVGLFRWKKLSGSSTRGRTEAMRWTGRSEAEHKLRGTLGLRKSLFPSSSSSSEGFVVVVFVVLCGRGADRILFCSC